MRLDALFRATAEIDLPGGQKGLVRALSDVEEQERHRYALLKSNEVEKELRDKTSLEYQIAIAPLEEIENPQPLIAVILEARRLDIEREARLLFDYQFIPMPDESDDKEERDVLRQREEADANTRQQRLDHIKARLTEVREKMEAQSMDTLRQMAINLAVLVRARRVMLQALRWYSVYTAVFRQSENGELERLFQSADEVSQTPTLVIDRLFEEVSQVNTVDPWEVSKNALTDSGGASLTS